jgi:hypothetical protein
MAGKMAICLDATRDVHVIDLYSRACSYVSMNSTQICTVCSAAGIVFGNTSVPNLLEESFQLIWLIVSDK